MKIQKKNGGGVGSGAGWGVRVDVNEELKFLGKFKKNVVFFGGGVRGGSKLGGQDGCERRIENSKKKEIGGSGRGVGLGGGVDVNEELKFGEN